MTSRHPIPPRRLLPVLALALLPAAAFAESPDLAAAALAAPCASCHGPDGTSPGAIPSLTGLSEERLIEKLTAFRDAPPPGTTVMTRHMKGYDDAQIAALARYFSEAGK